MLELGSDGVMRKNRNRGYKKLIKLENGLLKLVESLERKRDRGDWIDSLVVKESNAAYGDD